MRNVTTWILGDGNAGETDEWASYPVLREMGARRWRDRWMSLGRLEVSCGDDVGVEVPKPKV